MEEEDKELEKFWYEQTLPDILSGKELGSGKYRQAIDAAFAEYTRLDGLRGAFYLGAESCNCEGLIRNEYPRDDPQHKAFQAGYRAASKYFLED